MAVAELTRQGPRPAAVCPCALWLGGGGRCGEQRDISRSPVMGESPKGCM